MLSYDIDNDGYISNAELFTVLKMMTGDNLNDEQLQQIVDKTIIDAVGSAVCHVAVMRWPRWPASTKRMDRLMSLCVHQSGWFSRRPCDRRQPIYCQRLALTGPGPAPRLLLRICTEGSGCQDQDGDGKISFEEFAMLIANTDLENKMTIPF